MAPALRGQICRQQAKLEASAYGGVGCVSTLLLARGPREDLGNVAKRPALSSGSFENNLTDENTRVDIEDDCFKFPCGLLEFPSALKAGTMSLGH